MTQAIALIDGNNFYAACEQSIDPSLTRKPLIVLSNNDGCVIARSPEARSLGIAMGTPFFKIRAKINKSNIIVRSSNYALYGDISQRLMIILGTYSDYLEVYSIDEAFARIDKTLNNDFYCWASKLRAFVYKSLGLTIAIGIGRNKVQAKLANHLAKNIADNTGIFDFTNTPNQNKYLENISIENVWGIGPKMSSWCRQRGVNTAKGLRDMQETELKSKYGVVGLRIQNELKGETCISLKIKPAEKKQTCISRSFKEPVTTAQSLRKAISIFAVKASEKIRKQNQLAKRITIFANTSPYKPNFYSQSATVNLITETNNTKDILRASLDLTNEIFKPNRLFIKAGVILQNLQSAHYLQQSLLIESNKKENEKTNRLTKIIDQINRRYGDETISWAICGTRKKSETGPVALSLRATTRINEIPIAIA